MLATERKRPPFVPPSPPEAEPRQPGFFHVRPYDAEKAEFDIPAIDAHQAAYRAARSMYAEPGQLPPAVRRVAGVVGGSGVFEAYRWCGEKFVRVGASFHVFV